MRNGKYTPEIGDKLCAMVAEGKTTTQVAEAGTSSPLRQS